METKKFKFKTKKSQEGKKEGPSKKTIIAGTTAGGVASVAAGAGIAAATQGDEETEAVGPANLHSQEEQATTAEAQPTAQPEVHHTAATQQPAEPQEPLPEDPQDEQLEELLFGDLEKEESLMEGLMPDDEVETLAKEESLMEGLTPDDEASQILKDSLVDPDDIDEAGLINVDNLTAMETADGSQRVVAQFHTPDGDKYMLADLDGDGVFSDVLDFDGNLVATAEGGATLADLVEMSDDSAGYLPPTEEFVAMGDDPADDIIDTDEMLMAMLDDLDDNEAEKEMMIADDDLDELDDIDELAEADDDSDDEDLADDISDDEEEEADDDTVLA